MQILSYPAPRREPVRTDNGWCTQPWTPDGVLSTIRGGGWFSCESGAHDFEAGVQQFALNAQEVFAELLG
jgi:hypothetical protein